MTSLYTSYETSVALKEAGAPQLAPPHVPTVYVMGWSIYWNSYGGDKRWLGERVGDDYSVRAWRFDEILAALHGHLWQIGEADNLDYVCGAYTQAGTGGGWVAASSPPALLWSPVEAAAACWLAVLKAAGEAKQG